MCKLSCFIIMQWIWISLRKSRKYWFSIQFTIHIFQCSSRQVYPMFWQGQVARSKSRVLILYWCGLWMDGNRLHNNVLIHLLVPDINLLIILQQQHQRHFLPSSHCPLERWRGTPMIEWQIIIYYNSNCITIFLLPIPNSIVVLRKYK